MKINTLNNTRDLTNVQKVDNRDFDFKDLVNHQNQIKVMDEEDRLEMLGDGHRKEKFDGTNEYIRKKYEIHNIRQTNSFIDRHYMVMNNIRAIISDSRDIDLESRKNNQTRIDDFTKDLKSLALNIDSRLGTNKFDPKNLKVSGVLSLAQMGKVTIRSRKGKNERVLIYYTGHENKTIKIDLDKNTGDILLEAGKRFREVNNLSIRKLLEEKGYLVEISPGGEFLNLEENLGIEDLRLENIGKMDMEEGKEPDEKIQPGPSRASENFIDYKLDGGRVKHIGSKNIIEIEFVASDKLVGLSVMSEEEVLESLETIELALDEEESLKSKVLEVRDRLEIELDAMVDNIFYGIDFQDINEVEAKMEEIKDNIFRENIYLKYFRKIQDPGVVYKLLK